MKSAFSLVKSNNSDDISTAISFLILKKRKNSDESINSNKTLKKEIDNAQNTALKHNVSTIQVPLLMEGAQITANVRIANDSYKDDIKTFERIVKMYNSNKKSEASEKDRKIVAKIEEIKKMT